MAVNRGTNSLISVVPHGKHEISVVEIWGSKAYMIIDDCANNVFNGQDGPGHENPGSRGKNTSRTLIVRVLLLGSILRKAGGPNDQVLDHVDRPSPTG
jgi:hypothetical protein